MTKKKVRNALFPCTANSARGVIAECVLDRLEGPGLRGWSAGSHAAGEVRPMAVEVLTGHGYSTRGLRSKRWDEFAAPAARLMDYVITVCDSARDEVCPAWPARPISAHWSLPDPAAARGSGMREAFEQTLRAVEDRMECLVELVASAADGATIILGLNEIGGRGYLSSARRNRPAR